MQVRDGRLNLWFQSVKDNAIVSAIEVTRSVPTVPWGDAAAAPLPRFEAMGETYNAICAALEKGKKG